MACRKIFINLVIYFCNWEFCNCYVFSWSVNFKKKLVLICWEVDEGLLRFFHEYLNRNAL